MLIEITLPCRILISLLFGTFFLFFFLVVNKCKLGFVCFVCLLCAL